LEINVRRRPCVRIESCNRKKRRERAQPTKEERERSEGTQKKKENTRKGRAKTWYRLLVRRWVRSSKKSKKTWGKLKGGGVKSEGETKGCRPDFPTGLKGN